MKVIGINGSPRKDGNTALLLKTVFAELHARGIETELIELAGRPLEGCTACCACLTQKNARCAITGDFFNDCFAKMAAAEGIILGSPVYAAGASAQIKALIDRASMVLAANKGLFRHKVGAAVVAARRGGAVGAFDTLTHFLHSKEMHLVGSTYWNIGYGRNIGEVSEDSEGIANMKNLGENMAWLLKRLYG
ncbi:flavodoxin family protein [Anaeroselena agilis]|uniref:Flavodoxin family protein n=1 Tax=Anaeroselena agilis TaxID=3063788 RepID=A0ABU3P3M5_9FIRM|nr:flavodoxin family protein [Selenomonadales bacterium 4137-cl]